MRRWTALVAAVLLVAEAAAAGFIGLVLGRATHLQHMKFGMAHPGALSTGAYAGGAAGAVALLAVAALLVRVALLREGARGARAAGRPRGPGRPTRVVLVLAAVGHALAAAALYALNGVLPCVALLVVVALLVLVLLSLGPESTPTHTPPAGSTPAAGPDAPTLPEPRDPDTAPAAPAVPPGVAVRTAAAAPSA